MKISQLITKKLNLKTSISSRLSLYECERSVDLAYFIIGICSIITDSQNEF